MTSRLPLRFPPSARTPARRSRSSSPETRARAPFPARAKKSALHRLSAVLLGAFSLSSAAQLSSAEARTVKIVEAQTLELRNVDVAGLDGKMETQEFIVIAGSRVELRLDASTVVATRVEFNKTRRTLTLVGKGKYINVSTDKNGVSSSQTLEGENLVVDLTSEGVEGADVLVSTAQLDVIGQEIQRIPGQIKVQGGYFTPCGKCGETPNDYAFRARELIIYPGDRLVAYDAQILLADEPVFFLPVMVFWLGDKQHQPRLEIGRSDIDGYTALLDLPYVLGDASYGFSKLRFYQNRDPFLGFGVDHTSLDLFANLLGKTTTRNNLTFRALLTPRPLTSPENKPNEAGYLFDYNFGWRVENSSLLPGGTTEFSVSIKRQDSDDKGGELTEGLREVTLSQFSASSVFADYTLKLNYNDQYDHNLSLTSPENKNTVLKRPEFAMEFRPWTAPLGITGLSAESKFTVGLYRGLSNISNPSALEQSGGSGQTIEAGKLEANYALRYSTPLWSGATLDASQTYRGTFYSTDTLTQAARATAGDFTLEDLERNVAITLQGSVKQRIGNLVSFGVNYDFLRQEGESPFQFDQPPPRNTRMTASADLSLTPLPGITLGASQVYDLRQKRPEKQDNARFSATLELGKLITQLPLTLNYSVERNLFRADFPGTLERWNARANYSQGGLSATVATGWNAGTDYLGASTQKPFEPLTFAVGYTDPAGAGSLNLNLTRDLNVAEYSSASFEFIGNETRPISAPFSVNSGAGGFNALNTSAWRVGAREAYSFQNPQVSGRQFFAWGGTQLELTHDFLLKDDKLEPSEDAREGQGTLRITLSDTQKFADGTNTFWSLGYGGDNYSLERGNWDSPRLEANFNRTQAGQNLAAGLRILAPGTKQATWELESAALGGSFELIADRVALSGRLNYNRVRLPGSGTVAARVSETYGFTPLSLTFALGSGPRPGAYLTTSLNQTFSVVDGLAQPAFQPLKPKIALTIDRCCWALKTEIDLSGVSPGIKISLTLPDGKDRALFQADSAKTDPSFPIFDDLFGASK